jgi:hypothetical protein
VAAWTKPAIIIGSGMLALGAGLGVASVASADTPVAPTPTIAPSSPTTPGGPPPGAERPDWPTSPEQQEPDWPTSPEQQEPDWPTSPEQQEREAALIKVLAEMLGVDETEIKAALDEVRAAYEAEGSAALDAYLDEAVRSGLLTQDEADAIKQAVEEGLSGSY